MDVSVKSKECLPINIESIIYSSFNRWTQQLSTAVLSRHVQCKAHLFLHLSKYQVVSGCGPCVGTSRKRKTVLWGGISDTPHVHWLPFFLFCFWLSCVLFFLSLGCIHPIILIRIWIRTFCVYIYINDIYIFFLFRYIYYSTLKSFPSPKTHRFWLFLLWIFLGTSAGMVVSTKGVTISEIST